MVFRCLHTADKNKVCSIVFPAIGSGSSNFPADKVAEAMLKAMFDFVDEADSTTVETIVIILYYKDVDTVKVKTYILITLFSFTDDLHELCT